MRRVHQRVCRPILRSANKRNWQTTRKTVLLSQLAQWPGNGITEKGKPGVDGVNLAKGSSLATPRKAATPGGQPARRSESWESGKKGEFLSPLQPGLRRVSRGGRVCPSSKKNWPPKSPACCRSRHTGLSADDRVALYDADGWESITSAYGDRRWEAREIARLASGDALITMEMKSKMKCNEFSSGCVRRRRNEPRFRSGLHGDPHLMDWLFQLQRAEWVACIESSSPKTICICA